MRMTKKDLKIKHDLVVCDNCETPAEKKLRLENGVHLTAIDPGSEFVGFANWLSYNAPPQRPDLEEITIIPTGGLLRSPNSYITVTGFSRKVLVIERPHVGVKRYFSKKENRVKTTSLAQSSISLAIAVGRIAQAFFASGFEIVYAPSFGSKDSWIAQMLSISGRMPKTDMVKKLSVALAGNEYPAIKSKITHDEAAAVCMGLWWIKNNLGGKR
jgi:hypothetical protein